jgi:adenylate kinase family enzyme
MAERIGDLWMIAGPPGAGKSTVADALLNLLSPTPALLDKDTMYSGFVEAALAAGTRPPGEREGSWYDEHIKVHEYNGMAATAKEIRSKGCSVLLSGPFTSQIHNAGAWTRWVEQLGGAPVQLIWVRSDAESLRHRLEARGLRRDTEKLAKFDEFVASMHLNTEPVAEHLTIDNRLSAPRSIEEQLNEVLER